MIKRIFAFWLSLDERLRFILVGGYNTTFSYFTFFALNYFLQNVIHYLAILAISYLISISNSFLCFKIFVFQSKGDSLPEYLRVNLVYLGYFLLNASSLYILKEYCHMNILLAQLICAISLAILTYFAHKKFSFRSAN